jgi:hypothetical protein
MIKFIKEINITDEMLKNGIKYGKEISSKIKNSHTDGENKIEGSIGEECVLQFLGNEAYRNNTSEKDLMYKGVTIEVKNQTMYKPTVEEWNHVVKERFQDCNIYCFTRLLKPNNFEEYKNKLYKKGYIMGFITSKEFKKYSRCYNLNETIILENGKEWRKAYGLEWDLNFSLLKSFDEAYNDLLKYGK